MFERARSPVHQNFGIYKICQHGMMQCNQILKVTTQAMGNFYRAHQAPILMGFCGPTTCDHMFDLEDAVADGQSLCGS